MDYEVVDKNKLIFICLKICHELQFVEENHNKTIGVSTIEGA